MLFLQAPIDSVEYNVDPNRPTNFSNPMYDSFGDMTNGGANGQASSPQRTTIKGISTDPDPSPTTDKAPDIPRRGPLGAAAPADTGPKFGGFKPTNVDTDRDTAALVEEDDEDI